MAEPLKRHLVIQYQNVCFDFQFHFKFQLLLDAQAGKQQAMAQGLVEFLPQMRETCWPRPNTNAATNLEVNQQMENLLLSVSISLK